MLNGTFTDYHIFHTIESNNNYSSIIFQSTLSIQSFIHLQCNEFILTEIPMLLISSDNPFTPINANNDTELNHGDTIACDDMTQSFQVDFSDNTKFYLIPIPIPSATPTQTSTNSVSLSTTNTLSSTPTVSDSQTSTISPSPTTTSTISISPSTTSTNSLSSSATITNSNTPTLGSPPSTISASSMTINTNSNTLTISPSNISISSTPTETNTASTVVPSLVLLGPSMIVQSSSILNSVTSTSTPVVIPIGSVVNNNNNNNNLNCFGNNCNFNNIKDDITPNSELELITENGEQVGNIFFSDIEGSFDINFTTNTDSSLIGNIIVDITIYDLEGNSISQLPDDLKICLKEEKRNDDNICLSFFNTKTEEWECEDECLSREGNQYCGTTNHLTSFALLLNGKTSNSNCSSEDDYVILWLSLAFVGLAIILFIIVALVVEFKIRWKRRKLNIFLRELRTVEDKAVL